MRRSMPCSGRCRRRRCRCSPPTRRASAWGRASRRFPRSTTSRRPGIRTRKCRIPTKSRRRRAWRSCWHVEGVRHQPRHRALHGRQQRRRGVPTKHHDRITHLHIKDRKRNKGPNVQLGTGDTPIKECAALIRDEQVADHADPRARVSRCARHAGRADALAVELSKGVTRKISPRRRCDEALFIRGRRY